MGRHGIAETLTGALVLAVALVFMAYAVAHSGRTTSEGYTLQARFERIDGLAIGGDVRIAGVKVGSVTGERLDPGTFEAIVSMSISDGIQLPTDTGAMITSESLLGGKYISLSPGGDQKILKPGQMITVTQSSINIESLLGKFIFSATTLNGAKDKASADKSGGGGSVGGTGLPPLSK